MSQQRYTVQLLRAGTLLLDAGCMLGLIPKVVWSKSVPIDDKNRVALSHNCLLLTACELGPGPRTILLETGTGDKLDARSSSMFGLDGTTVHTELARIGQDPVSVDAVIVSHLHFDHAGGLTRLAGAGQVPDWTGPASSMGAPRPDHGVVRSFPRAQVVVQNREWLDAQAGNSVMTRTYFADHLEPIATQLRLVDSPSPFPPGLTPTRSAVPLPQHARETEVFPGVWVFKVPGHTWGQQATRFIDDRGRSVVFVPDVMPTRWHVGQAYSLSYDVEPYTSMLSRTWLLAEAARLGWVLMLDHEPGQPFVTVHPDGKGWFELRDAEPLTGPSASASRPA